MTRSMNRSSDWWDNLPMKSCFKPVKTEQTEGWVYQPNTAAKADVL